MKTIVLFFLMGLTVSAHAQGARPGTVSKAAMSTSFHDRGYRAVDALKRLPLAPSLTDKGPDFDQRLLDSEKAIDEAKYVASTNKDKEVVKKLQASVLINEAMVNFDMLDARWKPFENALWQCMVEVNYEFEPEKLTAQGKATAKEGSCLAKEREAFKAMGESVGSDSH